MTPPPFSSPGFPCISVYIHIFILLLPRTPCTAAIITIIIQMTSTFSYTLTCSACISLYIDIFTIILYRPPALPVSHYIISSHRRAHRTALSQRAAGGGAAGGEGKITFLLGIWIPFIWFGQNLAWTNKLTLGTSLWENFLFFSKSKMAAFGQRSKIDQIWPYKLHFGSAFGSGSSDLDKIWHGHTTWP